MFKKPIKYSWIILITVFSFLIILGIILGGCSSIITEQEEAANSSLESNTEEISTSEEIEKSKETDHSIDMESNDIIDVTGTVNLDNITKYAEVELSAEADHYKDIIKALKEEIPDFDITDYKVFANEFSPGNCLVSFAYYIDDIKTSSVIDCAVVNNNLEYISISHAITKYPPINRQEILELKAEFEKTHDIEDLAKGQRESFTKRYEKAYLTDQTREYFYDFSEGVLYFVIYTVYTVPEMDNVQVPLEKRIAIN